VWRLAVKIVPPGDTCKIVAIKGSWRLAARGSRQAVWKRVSPGGSGAAPGDNVEARRVICLLSMCVIYNALVIPQRSACWSVP